MYHKSVKRNMGLSVLILVLVSVSIGYAIISSNLELNGNAEIANMAWNIYFDNISVTDGSTGLSVPTLSSDKTSVSFTTSFTEPTDYYDFTLDLINDGTLAAKVDSVTLSGLTTEQDVYANYRVTYVGGGAISAGDTLNPGEVRKVRVRLEMDPDVDATSLPSEATTLSLSAKINFVQGDEVNYLYDLVASSAVLDSIASDYVTSSTGIDFTAVSSDTNGKGVYTLTSSKDDTYPVHYYRGAVTNNNVIFGGFCWKIVRTTETGGVKLIYNGTPTDGTCVAGVNETPVNATIGQSQYNSSGLGAAAAGYMYGEILNTQSFSYVGMVFGKNFTYADGYYTLTDITTGVSQGEPPYLSGYNFTCFTTSDKCAIAYQSYGNSATFYKIKNGKDYFGMLYDVLSGTNNDTSSVLKNTVDQWYENNIVSFQKNLEDTVWCNDRTSIQDFASASNTYSIDAIAYNRYAQGILKYDCSCKNDSFTVYSENGNGNLKYPIAVLTSDEVLASGKGANTDNYLFTNFSGPSMWTISPYSFYGKGPSTYILNFSATGMSEPSVTQNYYVRPAISLKVGISYTSGTGTTDDPYIIG